MIGTSETLKNLYRKIARVLLNAFLSYLVKLHMVELPAANVINMIQTSLLQRTVFFLITKNDKIQTRQPLYLFTDKTNTQTF